MDMRGKTILVTGANSGIGEATALALAQRGARVIVHGRRPDALAEASERIARASGSTELHLLLGDLSSQRQLRVMAAEVQRRFDRLDVLVNNAGLVLDRRRLSEDGIEMTLAVNHLAPFLLTRLLLDHLAASAPARVVTVSSEVHRRMQGGIDFEDLQLQRRYKPMTAYGRSKLANILFTRELARRVADRGITANAAHPGVVRTRVGQDGDMSPLSALAFRVFSSFMSGPAEGAATSVHLASAPELEAVTGGYFIKCQLAEPSPAAQDDAAAARLWAQSLALTGEDEPGGEPMVL